MRIGNVGDSSDYDYGALLVLELSVTTLGLRTEDVAQTYYFTANENSEELQDTYTVFTVTGDKITSEEVAPSGEPVETQVWSCVNDGITAYEYGETGFYFAGVIKPATGVHEWAATETENLEVCSICGYTREYVETASGTATSRLALQRLTRISPTAYGGRMSRVSTSSTATSQSSTPTSTQTARVTTPIARLQLISGTYTSTIDLAATGDVVVDANMLSSGDSAVVSTQELTKDGQVVDKSGWLAHGTAAGEFNGDVTATITRAGSVLEIVTEWTAPSGSAYVNHIVVDNFTLAEVTIQIGGYVTAVQGLSAKIGTIQATSAVDLKLGAEDNSTGYTGEGSSLDEQPRRRPEGHRQRYGNLQRSERLECTSSLSLDRCDGCPQLPSR